MVMSELKEHGKLLLIEGVFYTMTPMGKVADIQKELETEIREDLKQEFTDGQVVRDIGMATEFLTTNNWKFLYIDKKAGSEFVIGAPFNGGVMTDPTSKTRAVYVPAGYMTLKIKIGTYPRMNGYEWRIVPRIKGVSFQQLMSGQFYQMYYGVHPHTFREGNLCSGMPTPPQFSIDVIIEAIRSCINGSGKTKSSILDYNPSSPANAIEACDYGIMAKKLFEEKKTDDEIWAAIIAKKHSEDVSPVVHPPDPQDDEDEDDDEDEEDDDEEER